MHREEIPALHHLNPHDSAKLFRLLEHRGRRGSILCCQPGIHGIEFVRLQTKISQ